MIAQRLSKPTDWASNPLARCGLSLEAYKSLWDRNAIAMVAAIDALLDTDMRLPLRDGQEVFTWAYREGLLP
jgi:hypothetical protein